MVLSVVVPVYKEEKNIPEFLRRMTPILDSISPDYEIIFSMDPSPDRIICQAESRVAMPKETSTLDCARKRLN